MYTVLNDSVFQIICGKKQGTAFIISKNLAITAFHVVSEFESEKIVLRKNGCDDIHAKLHNCIDEKYKKLDLALLVLEKDIQQKEYLQFATTSKLHEGLKWSTRGYPQGKNEGENIILNDNNTINQHLGYLLHDKIDIQLNHNMKWDSYEGISGAPLFISNRVFGIINSEQIQGQKSRELYALSTMLFKEILEENNILVENISLQQHNSRIDSAGSEDYKELKIYDKRNLPEKLNAVCNQISEHRIKYYCREVASGKNEISRYSDQEISSVKYRVFETCQKELLDFIESNNSTKLTIEEIELFLKRIVIVSQDNLKDRSLDYKYPIYSKDVLKKIILDLINDCYLSFDEEGLYED